MLKILAIFASSIDDRIRGTIAAAKIATMATTRTCTKIHDTYRIIYLSKNNKGDRLIGAY